MLKTRGLIDTVGRVPLLHVFCTISQDLGGGGVSPPPPSTSSSDGGGGGGGVHVGMMCAR